MSRTSDEEASLERSRYFSAQYFTPEQWLSHLFQINLVRELAPRTVLEVGIGNGLTSQILKWLGYDVTTADINSDLRPDRVASVMALSEAFNEKYDVVICAEVLEHLPFESADQALRELGSVSGQWVVVTVPQPARQVLYLEAKLPKVPRLKIDWKVKSRRIDACHHWELGSVPVRKFEALLAKHFQIVKKGNAPGNHYHRYYVLQIGADSSAPRENAR